MIAAIQSEQLAEHGLVCDGDALMYGKRCISCGQLFMGIGARCGSCSSIVCIAFSHACAERLAEVMSTARPQRERPHANGWLHSADRAFEGVAIAAGVYLTAKVLWPFASGCFTTILGGAQ